MKTLWVLYNPSLGKRGWLVTDKGEELPEHMLLWVVWSFEVEDERDFRTYNGGMAEWKG